MALVIKKRISLASVGTGWEKAYLEFRSIPVADLPEVQKSMPKEEDSSEAKLEAIPTMLTVLKKYFISGSAPDDNGDPSIVSADDLNNIDADMAIKCFQGLTGVSSDLAPESENTSTPLDPTDGQAETPPSPSLNTDTE